METKEKSLEESRPEIAYIRADEESLPFFQALASKTRLQILDLLKEQERSIKELSAELGISSAITTRHIQALEEAGIVESRSVNGIHGLKKQCRLKLQEAQIIFDNNYKAKDDRTFTEIELPICSYASFDVKAPCGLANDEKIFGYIDDPRYFSAPNRYGLSLIWFASGYLEYPIPIYDVRTDAIEEIEISLEICSEHPGFHAEYPSDISFSFNGIPLGFWTSPGDYGDRKGRFSPKWWTLGSEYGLLKTLLITSQGTFVDGIKICDTPLSDYLKKDLTHYTFKIEVKEDAKHPGGLNLFGRRFGDYDQNIKIRFLYKSGQ